jgi:TPR repeat protein
MEDLMRKAVAILILSLIVPMTAGAQDLASLERMRQAAEQGSSEAQLEMGILYEFGYNMPKNDIDALAWYLRAAEQGNALASARRDLLKSRMKPEDVEAAQKLSSELPAKKPESTQSTEPQPAADSKPESMESPPPAPEPAPVDANPDNSPTPQAAEPAESAPSVPESATGDDNLDNSPAPQAAEPAESAPSTPETAPEKTSTP